MRCFLLLVFLFSVNLACHKTQKSKIKEVMSFAENHFLDQIEITNRKFYDLPRSGKIDMKLWNAYFWPYAQNNIKSKIFSSQDSLYDKLGKLYRKRGMGKNFDENFSAWIDTRIDGNRDVAWSGLCTGMAEAAFLIPIPDAPRMIDDIVFYPHEMKAIAAMLVSGSKMDKFLAGERANWEFAHFDGNGRPQRVEDRDTNPGTFHLALSNLINRQKPLVMDVNFLDPVLNFAVKSFEVKDANPISDQEELKKFKGFNGSAVSFIKVRTRVVMADSHRVTYEKADTNYDFVQDYEYVLELNPEGKIIGGEWIGRSISQHPDFIYTFNAGSLSWKTMDLVSVSGETVLPKLGSLLEELIRKPGAANASADSFEKHNDFYLGFDQTKGVLPPEPDDTHSPVRH